MILRLNMAEAYTRSFERSRFCKRMLADNAKLLAPQTFEPQRIPTNMYCCASQLRDVFRMYVNYVADQQIQHHKTRYRAHARHINQRGLVRLRAAVITGEARQKCEGVAYGHPNIL